MLPPVSSWNTVLTLNHKTKPSEKSVWLRIDVNSDVHNVNFEMDSVASTKYLENYLYRHEFGALRMPPYWRHQRMRSCCILGVFRAPRDFRPMKLEDPPSQVVVPAVVKISSQDGVLPWCIHLIANFFDYKNQFTTNLKGGVQRKAGRFKKEKHNGKVTFICQIYLINLWLHFGRV